MSSYLTTPSGIQMEILTTLRRHRDGLPRVYLAKMINKPEPLVEENLDQMVKANVIEVDKDKRVRIKPD